MEVVFSDVATNRSFHSATFFVCVNDGEPDNELEEKNLWRVEDDDISFMEFPLQNISGAF